jgi:pilus assembly protein CpaE
VERERGQASVELVAVLPLLVACALIAAQALPAGWALWSAGNAARAGARAEHVGGDGERAARSALPPRLRADAKVDGGDDGEDELRVSVRAPGLIPGVDGGRFEAATKLDPGDG